MPTLECYPMASRPPDIVPGRAPRGWMDRFTERHPYRCLPMTMANCSGWEMLCPVGFTAEWNGGVGSADLVVTADHPFPDFSDFAKSHFAHGVLTMHPGYLFRTPEGWSMWVMGPPNHIKDGIQPLVGLVETDWLPFPFTMNWHFTRPGKVRFEKGEPFCFITLAQDRALESFDLVQKRIDAHPDLRGQYDAWHKQRDDFNKALFRGDPEAVKAAWQRYYFRGELPEETGAKPPAAHTNRRRLKALKLGF
jgi:hypothetical protein